MITDVKPMACGNCGNGLFSMFKGKDLLAKCANCKSVSVITVEAELKIEWGQGAEGVLCNMAPTKMNKGN